MKIIKTFLLSVLCFSYINAQTDQPTIISGDTVVIYMAALDQPFMYNRLGTAQPTGMIFALENDIEAKPSSGTNLLKGKVAGNVQLRKDKRPRPIVLRANVGDIIEIRFRNYLRPFDTLPQYNPVEFYEGFPTEQIKVNSIYPATREAGVHIVGTNLVNSIMDDASYVGSNDNSLVKPLRNPLPPGSSQITYTLYAPAEGTFVLHSSADNIADGTIRAGQISNGLFGSLVVEPPDAEWYRSQVPEDDLFAATKYWKKLDGTITEKPNNPGVAFKQENKGFPIIDYNATKKVTLSGVERTMPILKMYNQETPHRRHLVHSDLTALITGPNGGDFPMYDNNPSFFNVPASPDRRQPYREFSIHYHEAPYAVQAFPIFYDNSGSVINNITQTLQGGVDQFAFNYGTGGIGAEIYANRIKVGPMADCKTCVYEEFFLSAWAVGDPAQIVDIPANSVSAEQRTIDSTLQDLLLMEAALLAKIPETQQTLVKDDTVKATRVYYPDDPSNVYHSYMNDHVKFRINHCGAGITHVHHQHAHQWLHSPNSDNGHYLDSQTINPGTSYTLEMVFGGSGNLNKTVGDQIFHCHFYPHFAQGMWAMWRVHDVLETGTVMQADGSGIVAANSRAYPDGEIEAGTPIPAIVPISTLPMAPIPSKVSIVDGQISLEDEGMSPGYPFFIPGIAGQRAPHPPLDFAIENGDTLDGGLPRNVVFDGKVPFENHTIYDWTKITDSLQAIQLPEEGTYYEQLAMQAHATRVHNTLTPTDLKGNFLLNGLPPVSGAPYANPAVDANGYPVGTKRVYKAANIQVDAVLNELGWHYPQQRPIVLWGDVASTISGEKPPEPFFMRANSGDYIEYWHTNLVPEYYELDDYQVRTPTDIIGQHIHLVKFDVTSSDGAANGWNYEDGTLSPQTVVDWIDQINKGALYTPGLTTSFSGTLLDNMGNSKTKKLKAKNPLAIWGNPPDSLSWLGAQTTIQRWYADPLYNNKGEDRTLRTVFTHDHFSPSTHQQIGLYAGLLIEPAGSTWLNSSTGDTLGYATNGMTRPIMAEGKDYKVSDGGPTDWQAIIQTADEADSYREFMFEFQDNQQAYLANSIPKMNIPYPEYYYGQENNTTFQDSVDNSYRGWIDNKKAINPPGTPQLVTTGNAGTLSVNYRNSPLPVRVAPGGDEPKSSDLAYAYSSVVKRGVDVMNHQPVGGANIAPGVNDFIWPVQPLSPGMQPGDPYTPLARAYNGDKVQIRTLVGAHVNPHFFNIHGVKWYFEPSFENSGYRSTQMMSLSEHFEMNFQLPYPEGNESGITDYLYSTNADDTGLQAGTWGLMRSYDEIQDSLVELPNNQLTNNQSISPEATGCGCPSDAPIKHYDVTAISIDKYQQSGPNWGILVYNEAYRNFDSKAIVFVNTDEINAFKHSKNYIPRPLVLRANAGDCIKVKVRNEITQEFVNNTETTTYASYSRQDTTIVGKDTTITTVDETFDYQTSFTVGLHAELLNYDVSQYDGTSVGLNSITQLLPQLDGSGSVAIEYEWYAGQWNSDGKVFTPEPVELGTVVLTAPDPLLQYVSGLFGALIVEPEHTYWVQDQHDPTSANVYDSKDSTFLFREFVLMFQDNINVPSEPRFDLGTSTIVTGATATSGLNYKSEPLASRIFIDPAGPDNFNQVNVSDIVSNSIVLAAPETPRFVAKAETPVRFRVMYPGGVGDGSTFDLHGHVWQEEPYTDRSTKLGYNPMSQWMGARGQLGALNSFDLLINKAGGEFGVTGDYLYRDYRNQTFQDGIWGLFTVTEGLDAPIITRIKNGKINATITGVNTVNPTNGRYANSVDVTSMGHSCGTASVNQFTGEWSLKIKKFDPADGLTVESIYKDGTQGGSVSYDEQQLIHLTKNPKLEVMQPVRRATVKKTEPGSNKEEILNLNKRPGASLFKNK